MSNDLLTQDAYGLAEDDVFVDEELPTGIVPPEIEELEVEGTVVSPVVDPDDEDEDPDVVGDDDIDL